MTAGNQPIGYRPITDWSGSGRKQLIVDHELEIRLLLDCAFTDFVDCHPLVVFGFQDDDPVSRAVEWSMERFVSMEIDPARLHPASRSFRLFTEARFWLSQKVGSAGYRRIVAILPQDAGANLEVADNGGSLASYVLLQTFLDRLVRGLGTLLDQTCGDMVLYWLHGTEKLRSSWFGWTSDALPARLLKSKKQRSLHIHDALFRFQVLHQRVARTEDEQDAAMLSAHAAYFQPCANEAPYRRSDLEVRYNLGRHGCLVTDSIPSLRRHGLSIMLSRLLNRATAAARESPDPDRELLLQSISLTTLHALDLESSSALREQLLHLYAEAEMGRRD